MNENERIDQAVQEQEDAASMKEAVIDRQIFAEMKDAMEQPKAIQPQATDFTRITLVRAYRTA